MRRDTVTLTMLTLASYRATRLVTTDTIVRPWREKLFDRWPPTQQRAQLRWNPTISGHVLRAGDSPPVSKIGQLVDCPWCCGWWLTGAVLLATTRFVSVPLPWLAWPALSTAVGFLGMIDGALS